MTFRNSSLNPHASDTLSSSSLQGLFRVSSGSLQGLFRVSSGSFQGLFRVSSGSSGSRQGLIHDLSLAFQTFLYNVFLELGGLPHVLPLAVHLE